MGKFRRVRAQLNLQNYFIALTFWWKRFRNDESPWNRSCWASVWWKHMGESKSLHSAFPWCWPHVGHNISNHLFTMSSTFYVPPPGLFCRLIGYVSQCVSFSRNARDAGHNSVSHGEYPDQWVTLLHNSGDHPGRYAIKGRTSGRVLFSRGRSPRVGHIEGEPMACMKTSEPHGFLLGERSGI